MVRRRGPLLLMISLLLAALAAWVANQWLAARVVAAPAPAQEQVVVAAIDIPLGTKIEQRHLSAISMLPGQAPKGSFHNSADVLGKVASNSIIPGEILLAPRLADSGGGSSLASVVDKTMRAVTVRVDDVVGVAGFLLPGNRVDVIATEKDGLGTQVRASTILSNVKVLAVDQTASSEKNEPVVVHAVTLEVTPADAEILLKGKTAGAIQLTLRNPLDESDARTPRPEPPKPVTVKAPVPMKPAAPEVMVLRGTQMARTSIAAALSGQSH